MPGVTKRRLVRGRRSSPVSRFDSRKCSIGCYCPGRILHGPELGSSPAWLMARCRGLCSTGEGVQALGTGGDGLLAMSDYQTVGHPKRVPFRADRRVAVCNLLHLAIAGLAQVGESYHEEQGYTSVLPRCGGFVSGIAGNEVQSGSRRAGQTSGCALNIPSRWDSWSTMGQRGHTQPENDLLSKARKGMIGLPVHFEGDLPLRPCRSCSASTTFAGSVNYSCRFTPCFRLRCWATPVR